MHDPVYMRCAAVLLFAALLAVGGFEAGAAGSGSQGPSRIWVAGRDYVRVVDWAKSQGLSASWTTRDKVVQLSGRGCRILLRVDSAEVEVNGVSVWLLFAVRKHSNGILISELDARAALGPLVNPARNRGEQKVRTICLDPGHGGKDPGNRRGWDQEKAHTLLLAQELKQQLTRAGFKVTLTRTRDTYSEPPTRPDIARQQRADLFISLHYNAALISPATVQGSEVYCMTPPGASSTNSRGQGTETSPSPGNRNNDFNTLLAYEIQKRLVQNLGAVDRGVRRARFSVLREATMPAVLVEAGFMSHPVEGKKITSLAYRRQIAGAIADGVIAYKRQTEGS